jgi:hypothetical protein
MFLEEFRQFIESGCDARRYLIYPNLCLEVSKPEMDEFSNRLWRFEQSAASSIKSAGTRSRKEMISKDRKPIPWLPNFDVR